MVGVTGAKAIESVLDVAIGTWLLKARSGSEILSSVTKTTKIGQLATGVEFFIMALSVGSARKVGYGCIKVTGYGLMAPIARKIFIDIPSIIYWYVKLNAKR